MIIAVGVVMGLWGLSFLYVGVPWIYGRWARVALERKARGRRALVLTYDDGPSSSLTPAILKMLAESQVKATFFLLGRNVVGREAIVRQIVEQGHEIGSHGYDHPHYWKVSPFRALSDIKRGWKAIDAALGTTRGKYPFRPPHGKLNLICLLYLLARRVPIVYWSIISRDTWRVKPEVARVALLAEEAGGAVPLAHDFEPSDEASSRFVLESTRSGLAMARRKGMTILTVSQLLDGRD
jgi:peptidoglycan-N-acetylglucosamine deacetylase